MLPHYSQGSAASIWLSINIYNKVPDPNVIGSMTGHVEGSRAFARYRTIEEDLKKSLVDILG